MMPRLRRLSADQKNVTDAFAAHPYIRVVRTEGTPAERYVVEFNVAGLVPDQDNFVRREAHQAEILLSLDYPRRPPLARMLTPVFHPNIDPQKICIGDHWSAGESLTELIVRIGQMITFQSYNVKSPLNAKAAAWAEQNESSLPLQKVDLTAGQESPAR
jgi:ubiquitin-protein ligase